MRLNILEPTKMYIEEFSSEDLTTLQKILTYTDKTVLEEIKRLKNNHWLKNSLGPEAVELKIEELKKESKKTLLFTDEKGIYTYPGLSNRIVEEFKVRLKFVEVLDLEAPEAKLIPWLKKPEKQMRYYQKEALDAMLAHRHCHVEIGTGGGKSIVILNLIKELGLKSLIVAPFSAIANDLYNDFLEAFGPKYVGMYGDGKKKTDKLFTIATAQAIVRIQPETEEWDNLSKCVVYCSDESHTLPAETFTAITNGIMKNAPYRKFLSATQERNDGKDLLLEGIIGERVYTKTIQQLQEEGYLAKLSTMFIDVESEENYRSNNIVKMNQKHLYHNKRIAKIIADITESAYIEGLPILILVDEHYQEELLKAYMRIPYTYAKGGSDTKKICKDFNSGKILVVAGTSAITTGTNFLPVRLTINWQGNQAGTKVKQGPIGRSTRIDERTGKKDCKIIDFRVTNVDQIRRHADNRAKYYAEVGPVEYMDGSSWN